MNLQRLIEELRETIKIIPNNCENFSEIIQLNVILEKFENLENTQANKIIFVGREGSQKTKIIENFSSQQSESDIFNKRIFMDTPCYNYSDELDNEIVNNCLDANVFVVVTNGVGSIGDLDRNFLREIGNKVFIAKLIFIFTGMEKVPDNEQSRVKNQHECNANRIANEILSVHQTNIPIFFVYNNELDSNKFLSTCDTFNLSLEEVDKLADDIQHFHEIFKGIFNKNVPKMESENSVVDDISHESQRFDEQLKNVSDFEKLEALKKLKEKWKNNIKNKKFKVDKENNVPVSSKGNSKTKERILAKSKEIENIIKDLEIPNKLPNEIKSLISEMKISYDLIKDISQKLENDKINSFIGKYKKLHKFATEITDKTLINLISTLLVNIDLELLLIMIYIKKKKFKKIWKPKNDIYQKRKAVLKQFFEKIICNDIIENKLDPSINSTENEISVEIKPTKHQIDSDENSQEILKEMLEKMNLGCNKIFV